MKIAVLLPLEMYTFILISYVKIKRKAPGMSIICSSARLTLHSDEIKASYLPCHLVVLYFEYL